MSRRYTVYGGELSYFTRKLEAALIFYGADFEMRSKTPDVAQEVEFRSGTHQVLVNRRTNPAHLFDTKRGMSSENIEVRIQV